MSVSVEKNDDALLSFAEEQPSDRPQERPWKLLVVDDEPEVHSVTRLALSDFSFDGRGLEFLHAHSGTEACDIVASDPEIAVMLLDVVMETDDAGLQVVQHVRRMLGNNFIRIILRTGHPGMAPERRVIKAYDINDYRAKTELTQDRMFSLMYTSLRAFKRMSSMAQSRRQMAALADEYKSLLNRVCLSLGPSAQDIGTISQSLSELQPAAECQNNFDNLAQRLEQRSASLQGVCSALQRLANLDDNTADTRDFSSHEVVQAAIETVQKRFAAKTPQIHCDNLPTIHGNPQRFGDLLEQLLCNAIEYQDAPAPEVDISSTAKGKDWEFTVADRGRGIPADQMDTCFEAFSGPGLGVGLALCRRIVAEFGGRIWVEARPDGGSLFKFTIPGSR